jgi:hypothetical protein
MTEVWLVLDVLSEDGTVFEIIAVCDSEALADQLCTAPNHCIFSHPLNTPIYERGHIPETARYPRSDP